MRFHGFLFSMLSWWVLALPGYAQTVVLDPNLDYQAERTNPINYDVDMSIVVTAPSGTKKLAVWIPVPPTDFAQEISDSTWSTFPKAMEPQLGRELEFGNQFAYFEFSNPQGAQIIRHRLHVKAWELNWRVEPQKIQPVEVWPDSFIPYRRNEGQAVRVDDRFRTLLKDIVLEPEGTGADLGSVIQWVEENFTYDHERASLRADSVTALNQRSGHCSDYHGFCAAMGRALGVPTRVCYGIAPFPKSSPSHCKLEAYLAPYGWVSFDVSETQKLLKKIENAELEPAAKQDLREQVQRRLLQGFRDHTWYLQTRGTDYELVPPARSGRVPLIRTAYMEADGIPLADPDPSNPQETKFAWMVAAHFESDQPVVYPFTDWSRLLTPKSN